MKQAGSASPVQLALRAGFGSLLCAGWAILLYRPPMPRYAGDPRVFWLYLLAALVLLLPGINIIYQNGSRLKDGVQGDLWSPQELGRLRRLLPKFLVLPVVAVFLIGAVVLAIHTNRLLQHGLDAWVWAWSFPLTTVSRLYAILNFKRPPSNAATWTDLKPIRSDHWGGMNHPSS